MAPATASADEPQAWCPRSWQHPTNVSARHCQHGVRRSGAPPRTPPCYAIFCDVSLCNAAGEPIPRSSATSLGGSLFSDRTHPFTGEPIPGSSTSVTSTRAAQTRACMPLSPPCRARASLSRCLDCYLLSFGPVGVFWPLCVLACFACVHISTFAALFLRMLCMNDTCTIYNRFCLICLTHLVSSKPCCSASSTEASSSSGWTSTEAIQMLWLLVYIRRLDS